jgi:hypothetical protein
MGGRIFRKQNYLLFLAAGINLSLVFAPLAYAANYSRNVYAWLHGSWIIIEKTDPFGGADNYSSVSFTGDFLLFLFVLLAVAIGGVLAGLIFVNQRPRLKQRTLLLLLAGIVAQALVALALRFRLTDYLGEAVPGDLESHLELQYWLHAFVLMFTWWAWLSVRRDARNKEKPVRTTSVQESK